MEEKKFYWIKLKTDFFNREDIDFMLSQPNGCQYVVLYQMLCLNTANTSGELVNKIGEMIVPYNIEKIVRDTRYFDYDTVAVALELYKKLGLIYEQDNGNLKISDVERMIGSESASREAIKKREQRLRKKIEGTQKGTNCPTEYRDKSIEYRDKILDNNIDDNINIYEQNFGTLSPTIYETIQDLENTYTKEYVSEAMKRAIINNKKSLAYVKGILKQWKNKTWDEIIQEEAKKDKPKVPSWFDKDFTRQKTEPEEEIEIEESKEIELTELEKDMFDIFNEY